MTPTLRTKTPSNRQRRARRHLSALTVLCGCLSGGLCGGLTACQAADTEADGGANPQTFTGYVDAQLIYVAAPSPGWLVESTVREGDPVAVGDLLFRLESDLQTAQRDEAAERLRQAEAQARDLTTGARPPELTVIREQLQEARATAELAALERERQTDLFEEGVAPRQAADQAIASHEAAAARVAALEANLEVAKLAAREAARDAADASARAAAAAIRQADWSLGQRQVTSRVAGRVEELFQQRGEFVAQAAPVLSILPDDALEVRFFVPQADLHTVAPGTLVEVHLDEQSAPFAARVTYVARQAEFTPPVIYSEGSRDSLVFLVRAHLEEAGLPTGAAAGSGAEPSSWLRPGQPVDVTLP